MSETYFATGSFAYPLAEVGDKVAQPLGTAIVMLTVGLVAGALLGVIHLAAAGGLRTLGINPRWWAWPFTTITLIGLGSLLPLDLVRYLFWDITDRDIQKQAVSELGQAWLWKCRLSSCGGFAAGFVGTFTPLCFATLRARALPPTPGRCLNCGYNTTTLARCPECGQPTAPQPTNPS